VLGAIDSVADNELSTTPTSGRVHSRQQLKTGLKMLIASRHWLSRAMTAGSRLTEVVQGRCGQIIHSGAASARAYSFSDTVIYTYQYMN
jgi:hypothetical protein